MNRSEGKGDRDRTGEGREGKREGDRIGEREKGGGERGGDWLGDKKRGREGEEKLRAGENDVMEERMDEMDGQRLIKRGLKEPKGKRGERTGEEVMG